MIYGIDSAYAPEQVDAQRLATGGFGFAAGYIGGQAEHVWTADEWARVAASVPRLLPIWVAPLVWDSPRSTGIAQGYEAVRTLEYLGFGRLVVLDVESGRIPRQFAAGFVDACHSQDLAVVLYGTVTTLYGLVKVPFDHWWLAYWPTPGEDRFDAPADFDYWQFATGPRWDYDVARDDAPFALLQSPSAPSGLPSAAA